MKKKALVLTLMVWVALQTFAQTQLQVTLWSGESTVYEVQNNGQLSFSGENLVINATSKTVNVPLASIRKITFPKTTLAVSSTQADEQNLVVFPNPATDVIYVSNLAEGTHSVAVYTIDGRLLQQTSLANGEGLNVSGLSHGLYLLKVGSSVVKFSKQ